jgi:SOS-response transcriptional repressor LexA
VEVGELKSLWQEKSYLNGRDTFSHWSIDHTMHWSKRLRSAMKAKGFKIHELAVRSGIAEHNIKKYLVGETDNPRGNTMPRLAEALDVSVGWLRGEAVHGGLAEPKAAAQAGGLFVQQALVEIDVPLLGLVKAGTWVEIDHLDQDEPKKIPALVAPHHAKAELFAVTADGSSMDKLFPTGTTVICLAVTNGIEVKDGDCVVVERTLSQAGIRERTLKQISIDKHNQVTLHPRSHDPDWQNPITLDGTEDDDPEGRILGVVRYIAQRVWG